MKVSKIDAAERQLVTAVNIFFEDKDPVSVHTLASASQDLLRGLGKTKGIKSFIKDDLEKIIKPEKAEEVWILFNAAQNHFKHANRDPDSILDFLPKSSEYVIWDSCLMLEKFKKIPHDLKIYVLWFRVNNLDIFPPIKKEHIELMNRLIRRNREKGKEFFRSLLLEKGNVS